MSGKILIADDKIKWAQMMAGMLRDLGYQVWTVDNGHDALALAQENRPDLLILDYAMPSFTGRDVGLYLRREPGFQTTPIIYISAHDDPISETPDAPTLKPFVFMPKPVDPDAVISQIQSLLPASPPKR